jgi:ComF family protein
MIFATLSDQREALESDMVVPVPLHAERQRERGFNQATVIARLVARRFKLRIDERVLARVKYTEMHRAGLDEIDRARSVERAFNVTNPRLVAGARVLLIDDLYTTGSTIRAVAETLISSGATRVSVLTVARAASGLKES